ncbi:PREDICTED: uncharacterized protein LOC109237105 [Nicotiana attenuata]|uniref:Uncharacterized protein n=1 Tax=Nicotiana attenuata TaxID=49451 RepID=A0A314LGQ3_NICAT|nr:PREDICTED: uncharacterized protein LOC109237105 [Nicotiana attenuata]OIT40209.1 hypothetical protein A4A49_29469 [Nicotiana attenuata]
MGIFRRLAGFLGFSKDEGQEVREEEDNVGEGAQNSNNVPLRKGFSVPVQVGVPRDLPGPILIACTTGHGGVQGLRWYAKRLRIDEDGDVADEFLNEIQLDIPSSTEENHRKFPRFELKYSTKPAKVTSQALSASGTIKHRVEYLGRLEWM